MGCAQEAAYCCISARDGHPKVSAYWSALRNGNYPMSTFSPRTLRTDTSFMIRLTLTTLLRYRRSMYLVKESAFWKPRPGKSQWKNAAQLRRILLREGSNFFATIGFAKPGSVMTKPYFSVHHTHFKVSYLQWAKKRRSTRNFALCVAGSPGWGVFGRSGSES